MDRIFPESVPAGHQETPAQAFIRQVARRLETECANRGITPEDAHNHTLQCFTSSDGTHHYAIDGERAFSMTLREQTT